MNVVVVSLLGLCNGSVRCFVDFGPGRTTLARPKLPAGYTGTCTSTRWPETSTSLWESTYMPINIPTCIQIQLSIWIHLLHQRECSHSEDTVIVFILTTLTFDPTGLSHIPEDMLTWRPSLATTVSALMELYIQQTLLIYDVYLSCNFDWC